MDIDVINLFAQGGFALVAIVILFYIVRYFMKSVNGFQEIITNHLESQTDAFKDMTYAISRFCDILERREK